MIDDVAASGRSRAQLRTIFEQGTHHRQLTFFDTAAEKFVTVETAYGTNHLQFNLQDRLWTSGDSVALGMLDTQKLDHTEAPRDCSRSPEGVA